MKTQKFDLVVLGGGNATSLAMRCAKEGLSVALIEADLLGGTCPNRGCVPSKLLLGFAEVATSIKHATRFYMDVDLDWIDLEKIRVETQTETIGSTDEWLEEKLPEDCKLFRGFGKFVGERQIEVNGEVLEGKKVVVATGTRPSVPEIFHDHSVWTSDDVFSMGQCAGIYRNRRRRLHRVRTRVVFLKYGRRNDDAGAERETSS